MNDSWKKMEFLGHTVTRMDYKEGWNGAQEKKHP
jgi:hypothetical protein